MLSRSSSSAPLLATALLLMGLLWGLNGPVASAQPSHTLHIRDGTVYVDGRPLADDQLPDSLDLRGVHARYRFLGIQRPVLELNGRLFAVEADGLTPTTEQEVREERRSVVLGGWAPGASRRSASDTPASGAEQGRYLNEIQRSSRTLYKRLLRERRMERTARDLAHEIRLMPEGPERTTRIDTLRAMLADIFALKQANRRREIQRLQRQIRTLQRNLQRRAQMRDRMIARHLRRLIDSTRTR